MAFQAPTHTSVDNSNFVLFCWDFLIQLLLSKCKSSLYNFFFFFAKGRQDPERKGKDFVNAFRFGDRERLLLPTDAGSAGSSLVLGYCFTTDSCVVNLEGEHFQQVAVGTFCLFKHPRLSCCRNTRNLCVCRLSASREVPTKVLALQLQKHRYWRCLLPSCLSQLPSVLELPDLLEYLSGHRHLDIHEWFGFFPFDSVPRRMETPTSAPSSELGRIISCPMEMLLKAAMPLPHIYCSVD